MSVTFEYEIQGLYDEHYGFETVTTEDNPEDAQAMLATYRANEPEYRFRVKRVRASDGE